MKRAKLIAVRPPAAAPGASLLNNKFFGGGGSYIHFGESEHWLRPYGHLRQEALSAGFELMTEDLVDLGDAQGLLLFDIPSSPEDIFQVRSLYPHLKLILQIIESPIGRLWTFDPQNLRHFDAVISYDDRHQNLPGFFVYKIPVGTLDEWRGPIRDEPWERRKLACLVAVMKHQHLEFPHRTGLGMIHRGWSFNASTWWNYVTGGGSLLRERQTIADELSRVAGNELDIFGPGWGKSPRIATRSCARGIHSGSKLDFLGRYKFTIAFENCLNDCGYISEKIFDALLAGSVPVYLGNESIHKIVAPEAYIDARDFGHLRELAEFLPSVSKSRWEAYRAAADNWLRTAAPKTFGAGQCIEAVLGALDYVFPESG